MYETLEQQDIDIFSSDPAGEKEKPGTPYYADGVEVGYTAPAKWWNWLWNHITAWFGASKTDKSSMVLELSNTLEAASVVADEGFNHQVSQAIDGVAYDTCTAYDNAEQNGHKINQPYVIGNTLYLPDTELL